MRKYFQNIDIVVCIWNKNAENVLDAPLTDKELQEDVYNLKDAKRPGIDGFTAEFFK